MYSLTRAGSPFDEKADLFSNITFEYEGFMWGRRTLEKSLERIKEVKPEVLVPSHGRIMSDPAKAIDALVARLDQCFEKYLAVNVLRGMFPDFANYVDYNRPDCLPLFRNVYKMGNGRMSCEGPLDREQPLPACVCHRGPTSWVLKSKDGPALLVDCGRGVEKELQGMVQKGEIAGVECLWITHYHDDHTDGISAYQKAFPSCSIVADSHVAEVISEPSAWPPLPCLMADKVHVDRVTKDGQSWQWHEFKLTAYFFPGQTLYHGGLLAETGDLRILFVGDSFDWSGLEDYCPYNRNWLGQGVGYDRCLELIEKLNPTHLLYAHSARALKFTPEELRLMRANLAEREKLFRELLPWDHPNYGMDGWWVRCCPYELHVKAGSQAAFDVVIMNHSSAARQAACRAVPPRNWGGRPLDAASVADASGWPRAEVPPKTEGRLHVTLAVPANVQPGRYAIPLDVRYDSWVLPQWAMTLVTVHQ